MNRKNISPLFLFTVLWITTLGMTCHAYVSPKMSKKLYRKVAVMPFKAANELIGNSVSDMFTTELLGTRLFKLVERNQISKILEEQALGLQGVTTSQQAINVGKILGVQGVIVGTVPEYGYKAVGSRKVPSVGLNIRMIDVEDGTVLWSISSSGVSPKTTNLSSFTSLLIEQTIRVLFKKLMESALLFVDLHFKNGIEYHGTVLRKKPHGKGRIEWPNGKVYTGDFVKGKRTGKGCLQWADGTKYTGDFVNGEITGKGQKLWSNGSKYIGEFVKGKLSGKGIYIFGKNSKYPGTKYTGNFANNFFDGKGRMEWLNGNVYIGDFVKGKRTGKGEMFFKKTGSRYIGEFENGTFHGQGTIIFGKNCILADGTYAATREHFKGSKFHYCESPGDKYIGKWKHGIPTGGWYYHKKTGLKTWAFYKNGKWVHLDRKP